MGHQLFAACVDCKRRYDLGYGSYGGAMYNLDTLAAFDAEAPPGAPLSTRNTAWRNFLVEHEGHRFLRWTSDFAGIDEKGDLRGDYDNDLMEPGVGAYQPYVADEDGSLKPEAG